MRPRSTSTPASKCVRPSTWLLFFALASALSACTGAIRLGQLDPPPGERMVVDVDIEGNDAVASSELIGGLATHSQFFATAGEFESARLPLLDRDDLPEDAARIEATYQRHGYFDARVLDIRIEKHSEDSVRVFFVVDERAPTRVATIEYIGIDDDEIEGSSEAAKRLREVHEELEALTVVEPDGVWTQADDDATRKQIRKALVDRGFTFAEVVGQIFVDKGSHAARVEYQIAHGPLVHISEVRVEGTKEIPPERIMRRVDLEQGDIVDPVELRRTEEHVFELGNFFFARARVDFRSAKERLADQAYTFENIEAIEWEDHAPVVIRVQERPMQELRAGAGAQVDNERSDIHVDVGYEHRNFIGGLRKLDLAVRPALFFLPTLWSSEIFAIGGTASLGFEQPSFIEEYLKLAVNTSYELFVDYGYRRHSVIASPRLSRSFLRYFEAFIGYRAEFYSYFQLSDTFDAPAREALGFSFRKQYLISALEQGITFDVRDDVLDPKKGVYSSLTVTEALSALGSDFEYYRLLGDIRGYYTPWSILTLALRFKLGRAIPAQEEVPLTGRFRGGGPNEMRGFGAGRMGPVVCVVTGASTEVADDDRECTSAVDDRIYVGGNVLLIGNFETRWRLPGSDFGLVAFVDVGEVYDTQADVSLSQLNIAVGPGARYYTDFGPIRLDLGFLLTTPQPPELSFHFSIGQAF